MFSFIFIFILNSFDTKKVVECSVNLQQLSPRQAVDFLASPQLNPRQAVVDFSVNKRLRDLVSPRQAVVASSVLRTRRPAVRSGQQPLLLRAEAGCSAQVQHLNKVVRSDKLLNREEACSAQREARPLAVWLVRCISFRQLRTRKAR